MVYKKIKLAFLIGLILSTLNYYNVLAENNDLKYLTEKIIVDDFNNKSLYEFMVDNNYSLCWNYCTGRKGRLNFINNSDFNTLNRVSQSIMVYSNIENNRKNLNDYLINLGISEENLEKFICEMEPYNIINSFDIKKILSDKITLNNIKDSIFTDREIEDNFYYTINRSFVKFLQLENLQKILLNHGINEEILNYALINSDYSIIWLQTAKDNYYMVYDLGSCNEFIDNDENEKHYKLYNQKEMKERFETKKAELAIDGKKIMDSQAIIQDKEKDETILLPIRSIFENMGAKVSYYNDNGVKVVLDFEGNLYTIDFSWRLIYKGGKDDLLNRENVIAGLNGDYLYDIIDNKMYLYLNSFELVEKFGYKVNVDRQNSIINLEKNNTK